MAAPDYKFVEVIFKLSSWLLTLVGITLAAQLSHSRALFALSIVLISCLTIPFVAMIRPYPKEWPFRASGIIVVGLWMVVIIALNVLFTWRLRLIVDAIIAGQHPHQ